MHNTLIYIEQVCLELLLLLGNISSFEAPLVTITWSPALGVRPTSADRNDLIIIIIITTLIIISLLGIT